MYEKCYSFLTEQAVAFVIAFLVVYILDKIDTGKNFFHSKHK